MTAIYPPAWLTRLAGRVGGRLLVFAWSAWRYRPHVVGGFHLLINGLVAMQLARLIRAKAMYFCVGGPREITDGGIWGENRIFSFLEVPDRTIERRLIRFVGLFDIVITMGRQAIAYYRQQGLRNRFEVVSGGINPALFHPGDAQPDFDLILVGRLAEIKRIDIFINAVAHLSRRYPQVKAAIVGDGPQHDFLRRLATESGIAAKVDFLGHQENVAHCLRRAKLFVLTSDSEGLALSLMEAMTCGLPAIVSDVGELACLVRNGVNGYLVSSREAQAFAAPMMDLLTDEDKRRRFAAEALKEAAQYSLDRTSHKWSRILRELT